MKYSFLLFQLFYFFICNGQKNDNNWLITHNGTTTSQIDFRTNQININVFETIPIAITNASFCSNEGNLQYYTNGLQISDANKEVIENGDSLNIGDIANVHANLGYPVQNGAFFLPMPGDSTKLYLFHMYIESIAGTYILQKLYYSLIDRSANNGLGKVIEKNVPLMEGNDLLNFDHAGAVRHANGRDWWIILPHRSKAIYYRFLFTPNGVSQPEMQEIGDLPETDIWQYGGYNLFSPNGTKYVNCALNLGVQVFDFDRCTGLLSNPIKIEFQLAQYEHYGPGIAFSPNERFLYMTHSKGQEIQLVQYDLNAPDIANSEVLISNCPTPISPYECSMEFLLLGPDNKIYVSAKIDTVAFHLIHQPDSLGLACDFQFGGFPFTEKSPYGAVPYFPNYRLYDVPGSPCDTLGINAPPVAVSDLEKEAISFDVYPNPTSGHCNVSFKLNGHPKTQVKLTNLFGHVLESHEVIGSSMSLSLSGLPTGIYFVQITVNGKLLKTEKLMKY